MAEYIEREATCEDCVHYGVCYHIEHYGRDIETDETCEKFINAADVVEVRHGEWIKDTRTADVCAEYRCSFCGFMYCEADPKYPPYKYCPECGSKNE